MSIQHYIRESTCIIITIGSLPHSMSTSTMFNANLEGLKQRGHSKLKCEIIRFLQRSNPRKSLMTIKSITFLALHVEDYALHNFA